MFRFSMLILVLALGLSSRSHAQWLPVSGLAASVEQTDLAGPLVSIAYALEYPAITVAHPA